MKVFRYLVLIITILIALIYLRADYTKDIIILGNLLSNTYNLLPDLLLVILLIILAIAIVIK